MKQEKKRMKLAEGWLFAAVFALVLLLNLFLELNRRPLSVVEPVHSLSAEAFVTPAPEPIDLNAATADQLAVLPGIGEALAEEIIAYRTENGKFSSVGELDHVPGIGEGKLQAIQALVFCG